VEHGKTDFKFHWRNLHRLFECMESVIIAFKGNYVVSPLILGKMLDHPFWMRPPTLPVSIEHDVLHAASAQEGKRLSYCSNLATVCSPKYMSGGQFVTL